MNDRMKWESFWGKAQGQGISWSKKRILNVLDRYLTQDMTVLDAGCGSGFFTAYFCDKSSRVVAVDYSEKALNLTGEISLDRAQTYKVDLLSKSLPEALNTTFDLIFSDGLFEHFPEKQQDMILANFKEILKPDGYLITFVPNLFSAWTLIRPFLMPGIEEKPFTINRLMKMNRKNGFKPISYGGVNVFPWKLSPEGFFPERLAMLIYTIARKD